MFFVCVFSELSSSTVGVSGMFDKTLHSSLFSVAVNNSPSSSAENSISLAR